MSLNSTLQKASIVLVMLLSTSCEKEVESIQEENTLEATATVVKKITYKGLPVNHRFPISAEQIESEITEESLKKFYNIEKSKNNDNLGSTSQKVLDAELPDNELLAEASSNVYNQFPFPKFEEDNGFDELLMEKTNQDAMHVEVKKELIKRGIIQDVDILIEEKIKLADAEVANNEKANWEMIKQDFSSLNEEEISKNIDLINEYYAVNFNYVTLKEMATNEEEIKNSVAEKRIVNNSSTKKQKGLDDSEADKLACASERIASKGYVLRSQLATVAYAANESDNSAEGEGALFLNSGGSNNTREDAYRHMLFNALLCNYYIPVTIINPLIPVVSGSSKVASTDFARTVADAYEGCTEGAIDSKTMDYHNNHLGREIWADRTSYRKVLGVTVGLNRPSFSALKYAIYYHIQNWSCFIVKHHKNNENVIPNNELKNNNKLVDGSIPDDLIAQKINETSPASAVYFDGTIAPPTTVLTAHEMYFDCVSNNLPITKVERIPVYYPYTSILLTYLFVPVPNDCVVTSKSACYRVDY